MGRLSEGYRLRHMEAWLRGRAPGPNPLGHGPRLLRNAFVRTLPSLMRHEVTLVGAIRLIAANFIGPKAVGYLTQW